VSQAGVCFGFPLYVTEEMVDTLLEQIFGFGTEQKEGCTRVLLEGTYLRVATG
jgi:hypothetical protein